MNKIIIRRSKAAMMFFILPGALFTVVSIIALFFGDLKGLCMIPLALGGVIFGVLGLRDKGPQIIIDNSELWVRELGEESILWRTIKSVRIERIVRIGDCIILDLETGEKYRFYADAMELSSSKILSLIRERIPDDNAP